MPTRLRDSVIYSYNYVTTICDISSLEPSINFIEFHSPIEIDCFFGVTQEPADPINFQEASLHPSWQAAMQLKKDSLIKLQDMGVM